MKKIRVIFLIGKLHLGGTERQLVLLAKYLDRSRFTPIIVTLEGPAYVTPEEVGCDIHTLNISSSLSWKGIKDVFYGLRYIRKLYPDVIHSYFIDGAIFGVIIGTLLRVKCIVTSRRDLGYWYTRKTLTLMKVLNKFTDRIVVNSNAIKNVIKKKENIKRDMIDVIHNGIDLIYTDKAIEHYRKLHRDKLGINESTKVVGIVSNLSRDVKRVDIFLKAATSYFDSNSNSNTVFIVVGGEGRVLKKYINMVLDEVNCNKIYFLGLITAAVEVTCSFDLAVNTSETEGFSNSVLESMAHGICTIATDNPGNAELIENNKTGVLFPVNDVDCLVKNICYLLDNDDVRFKIGRSAKEEVTNKYSITKMISRHEEFYINALGKKYEKPDKEG